MRKLVFILTAVAVSSVASAQSLDKITTKDGSFYNGFMSEQVPGKQVLVYAEYASILFNQKDVKNLREDYYHFDRLSDVAKDEARRMCDTTSLKLSSFEYKGRYYENMHISDRGDSTFRAYALTPRTYIIPWTDLSVVEKIKLNDQEYGIREIVTLKGGERLVGQIIRQDIAKSMTFKSEDGIVRTIPLTDILSIMSEKISEKHTIWQQIPLLDRVIDEKGNKQEGFITSRVTGQYVNMLPKYSHVAQQIPMKDISKFQKTPNLGYEPFVPDTAKVVSLNTREVELVSLKAEGEIYPIVDTLFQKFFVGTELHLSIKNIDHSKTVALYKYENLESKFDIKKMFKQDEDKCGILKEADPIYETTFVEVDGYQTCNVMVRRPGKYFLAIDGFKSGINLEILEEIEEEKK